MPNFKKMSTTTWDIPECGEDNGTGGIVLDGLSFIEGGGGGVGMEEKFGLGMFDGIGGGGGGTGMPDPGSGGGGGPGTIGMEENFGHPGFVE